MTDHDLQHRYSQTIYRTKVALLGPYTPPLGGVSVHIQRVISVLRKQNNEVYQFNTTVEYRYRYLLYYLIRLAFWLFIYQPKIVHYHTPYLSNSLTELLLLKKLKRILGYSLTIIEHDCRHMHQRTEGFKKKYAAILHSIDQLVLIGSLTYKSYCDAALVLLPTTSIEAAFLPPDESREHQVIATYPTSLHTFLYNHSPLILGNAFQLSQIQGKDLYGVDLCLQMVTRLAHDYPRLGFVLALAQIGNEEYFRHLCFIAHKMQIADNLYILSDHKEIWPLMKRVDLFVRPTRSDGASVSVQEALYFGTPVVTSDVCVRPAKTIVFENQNVDDFVAKVSTCLKGHEHNFQLLL